MVLIDRLRLHQSESGSCSNLEFGIQFFKSWVLLPIFQSLGFAFNFTFTKAGAVPPIDARPQFNQNAEKIERMTKQQHSLSHACFLNQALL